MLSELMPGKNGEREPVTPEGLEFRKSLGALFRAQRKAMGKDQTWLGQQVGLPQTAISKIELGDYNLSITRFRDISEALNLQFSISAGNDQPNGTASGHTAEHTPSVPHIP